jgi:hypothetical protein
LEDLEMLKKAALAVFGLVLALSFSAPKAQAEVHVGLAIGTPAVYGSVAVLPASHAYCGPNAAYYDSTPYTYYDNSTPYAYYDNGGSYAYYDNPYTTYGTAYYGSNRYYSAPAYGNGWRDREYRHHDSERSHEGRHENHDHDRR